VSEARGLDLPAPLYRSQTVRSLAGRDPAALAALGYEWVVLSSDAWGDRTAAGSAPALPPAYAHLAAASVEVKVITPTPDHPGPELHVLRMTRK
jgi:hypothetical protein